MLMVMTTMMTLLMMGVMMCSDQLRMTSTAVSASVLSRLYVNTHTHGNTFRLN